jgi:hypothetical protein
LKRRNLKLRDLVTRDITEAEKDKRKKECKTKNISLLIVSFWGYFKCVYTMFGVAS